MKRNLNRLVALCLSAALLLAISGCGGKEIGSAGDDGEQITAAQQMEPTETIPSAALDTQPEELVKFNWIGMDSSHLYRVMGSFLEYYDFGRQEWLSLCSSPNCDHTSNDCAAYVGDVTWADNTTPYEGKIYYLRCMNLNQVSLWCFDPAAQTQTEICQMESIGAFSASSSSSYIRNGVFVYQEGVTIEEGELSRNVSRVVQIDIDTGKTIYSAEFDETYTMLGVYQEQLIGIAYSDPTESEEYDPDVAASYEGGYYAYLDTIPVTLTIYTMPFGEEGAEWTAVWSREDAGDFTIAVHNALYGNYFLLGDGPKVFAVDILTGEEHPMFTAEGIMASLESVIGDELFYIDIAELSEDGATGQMTKCVLNLTTGDIYQLGDTTGTGNPFFASVKYFIQESVQYIEKEDYYLGNWKSWIPLG